MPIKKRRWWINLHKQQHSISLNNVNFDHCKAVFGGAVFIRSCSNFGAVNIFSCHFTNCQTTNHQVSSDIYTGGSALFLSTKKSSIFECNFLNNIGENQFKIYNNFDTFELLENFPKVSNIVNYCRFVANTQSKSSLFYFTGMNGVGTFVKNSFFTGELYYGNYHINGKSISKFSPKLIVEWCKFSYDNTRAFCTDSEGDYVSAVFHKRVFNYNSKKGINRKDIFGYSLIALGVVVVIIIVVLFKKKADTTHAVNDAFTSSVLNQDNI